MNVYYSTGNHLIMQDFAPNIFYIKSGIRYPDQGSGMTKNGRIRDKHPNTDMECLPVRIRAKIPKLLEYLGYLL
jgi:hypothetical protein